jgi:hypothetical protein
MRTQMGYDPRYRGQLKIRKQINLPVKEAHIVCGKSVSLHFTSRLSVASIFHLGIN